MDYVTHLPVNHEWIEQKINEKHDLHAKLIKISEPVRIDEGHGFMSFILSVELTWDQKKDHSGEPSKILFKILNTTKMRDAMDKMTPDGSSKVFQAMDDKDMFTLLHKNECQLYEVFTKTKPHDVPFPLCYYTQHKKGTEQPGMLMLEDFTDRGGCVNVFDGLTVSQVLAIADSVASYQAYSLINSDWRGQFWKPSYEDFKQFAASIGVMYDKIASIYPDECNLIPRDDVIAIATLDDKADALVDYSGKYVASVLCHGDLWTNNIIFEKRDGKFTDKLLALIDWQLVHEGNPGDDLARLMCTSMDGDLRRAHELSILHHYYDRLQMLLQSCGKSAPFSVEDVIAWYYRSMRVQSFQALMIAHLMSSKGQYDPKAVHCAVLRGVYAIQDTLSKATWDFMENSK